jgi:predicted Zn finger-like uncharacterized protein
MILTCPNCATRYFLNDVAIGRAGRMVKCTSCANTWRAYAEPDEPLALAPSQIEAPPPEPDPQPETFSDLPGDKLSQTFRARAQVQRKVREAAATGAIWAGLAAGLVLVIALAAVFRLDVVRLWPKTASAYASVGLPVNTTGLIIEQVKATPTVDNGRPAVSVSGVMRNIVDRAVTAPSLRVSLLNKAGRPVARRLADPPAPQISPGEIRHFAVSMVNPPQDASDVEVTFALDQPAAKSAARGAPAPKLRGLATEPQTQAQTATRAATAPMVPAAPLSAAREAKPLPPTSPYALPATAKSVSS